MKTAAQLSESIDRFQKVFWQKQSHGRPPIGIVNTDIYLPVKYLRHAFPREHVQPEDVRTENVMTDYEFAFSNRPVNCDDWVPFAAPWRAIPWLEAWCGCPVRFASGALGPEAVYDSVEDLAAAEFPVREDWFTCLREQTQALVANAATDCWISPTILRGPADVMAALRGLTNFLCDLCDRPELIARVAERIHTLLLKAIDQHFSVVKPKCGGYGHIFGYWAPSPTIALQEDAMGLCCPNIYRDLFLNYNAEAVKHLGSSVVFHLHSTGCQHYRDVLRIPGLAGLQMTIEANGPSLPDLLPVFREILEHSRLLLFLDHRFEELLDIISLIPQEGLYLAVPERCLPTESAFRQFIKSQWPTQG